MSELRLEPYESGRKGKPDRFEAGVAHLIGARLLEQDPHARFNVRVEGKYSAQERKPLIIISGEVSESLLTRSFQGDATNIFVRYFNHIHRATAAADDFVFLYGMTPQAMPLATNGNTGDSGRPMAVAVRGAPLYMPWERYLAVGIRQLIDTIYRDGGAVPSYVMVPSGIHRIDGLRADGKVDVGALFEGQRLHAIKDITVSLEHEPTSGLEELRQKGTAAIAAYLKLMSETYGTDLGNPEIRINPGGAWHEGGWRVDAGSAEAKPHEDYFGNRGTMEDSPWGEDATKPSGIGTLLAWHIARWVVHHELADTARVALTYIIGTENVGINIMTDGTGTLPQSRLEALVQKSIPLDLNTVAKAFQLRNPQTYRRVVDQMDLFVDPEFPWNTVRLFA